MLTCNLAISELHCSGYIQWLRDAYKPPITGSLVVGGSYWSVLHRDFVEYMVVCLDAVDQSELPRYCATVRGLYDYFYTNMIPGELFVPTALMNGPHCRAVRTLRCAMRLLAPCSNRFVLFQAPESAEGM